jgi:hypothetical protein
MSVNDYDAKLFDVIEGLVADGEFGKWSPAFGVARQVIHNGYKSLTRKQRALYDGCGDDRNHVRRFRQFQSERY